MRDWAPCYKKLAGFKFFYSFPQLGNNLWIMLKTEYDAFRWWIIYLKQSTIELILVFLHINFMPKQIINPCSLVDNSPLSRSAGFIGRRRKDVIATFYILYFNKILLFIFIYNRSSRIHNSPLEEQHPGLEVSQEEEERVVNDELLSTTSNCTPTPSHEYSSSSSCNGSFFADFNHCFLDHLRGMCIWTDKLNLGV